MLRFDDDGQLLPPPVLSLPGDGMTIERIPMPDEVVRVEALKVAISLKGSQLTPHVIDTADRIESYIRDGKPNAEEPGVWCIGPEESNQIMSIYSEGVARAASEKYPDTIYFFARLGN